MEAWLVSYASYQSQPYVPQQQGHRPLEKNYLPVQFDNIQLVY